MSKLFGTDGIRGLVPTELDADLALKIGASTSRVLKENKSKLTFLVGYDTRISKDVLKQGLVAGILGEGADVIDMGVIPTPAISHLIKKYKADGGFVISASHNPSKYNGIKVFGSNGMKLRDEIEEKIESIILNDFEVTKEVQTLGIYKYDEEAKINYVEFLKSTLDGPLSKLKVLVDVANGASYETARMLFDDIGLDFTMINDKPDGTNINENSGSTHIEGLQEKVKKGNFDCGIAFDGDADRCLLVDELGNLVDGDKILAICSAYLKKEGKLKNNAVVGTVMSNMGLKKFCQKEEINFIATKVGDRYVLENMLQNDYVIGGEQSGHIIFLDHAVTGDGELTALLVLQIMSKTGKTLSELSSIMEIYPQVLENVEVTREAKEHYMENEQLVKTIEEIEKELGEDGRVLIRPSGTENLIRIMLEGKDIKSIKKYCQKIISVMMENLI